MVAAAIVGGAAISGVSGLIGSSTAAGGARDAAQTNLQAQMFASQTALQEQQIGQSFQREMLGYAGDVATNYGNVAPLFANQYTGVAAAYENPFIDRGNWAGNQLQGEISGGQLGAMPSLTDVSGLPGYEFTRTQGLRAVQNAAAAKGRGVSGAAMRGAADYATGLADTYYNDYIRNYWANQNNRYNMLAGVQGIGANAANQIASLYSGAGNQLASGMFNLGSNLLTGALGTGNAAATNAANTASTIANATTQTAAQVGAAQQNAANLQAAGFTGAGSSLGNALLFNELYGGGGGGGSTIGTGGTVPVGGQDVNVWYP